MYLLNNILSILNVSIELSKGTATSLYNLLDDLRSLVTI